MIKKLNNYFFDSDTISKEDAIYFYGIPLSGLLISLTLWIMWG